jgi:exopolysaccharide biosynthesis polyprenyl glycosylphosphotransferase
VSELRGIEVTQMSVDATVAAAPLPPVVDEASLTVAAPRRQNAQARWALHCLGVDAATLTAAAVASMVGARAGGIAWSFNAWTVAFCLLTAALFQNRALYQLRLRIPVLDDVRRIAVALTVAAALVLAVREVFVPGAAAADIVRPWLFALVYVSGGRVALYWSQTKARVARETVRETLIVGAGRVGRVVARRLLAEPALGLRPVGFVDGAPLLAGEDDELELPVLDDGRDLETVLERYAVDHLIVTFSNERDDELLALVNRAEAVGVTVSIVPRLYEKLPERATIEHLGGLPLLTPHATNPRGFSMAVKYAIDRVAAALLIVLAAPFLIGSAIAVYISMGRPIFFKQTRIGRDGAEFDIFKFRSMKLPTPEELEAQARAIAEGLPGGVEGVDRRTAVGTFLRKTSLDELPQLFNVLLGDMSIVGPRPERPEYVSKFEHTIYRYTDRHRVKSGITGWAQVHGLRGKTSIDDRAEWDNWYVENASLWLDVKILALTVLAVVRAFADVE